MDPQEGGRRNSKEDIPFLQWKTYNIFSHVLSGNFQSVFFHFNQVRFTF